VALRLQGKSYDQIAERLGVHKKTVPRLERRGQAQLAAELAKDPATSRLESVTRIRALADAARAKGRLSDAIRAEQLLMTLADHPLPSPAAPPEGEVDTPEQAGQGLEDCLREWGIICQLAPEAVVVTPESRSLAADLAAALNPAKAIVVAETFTPSAPVEVPSPEPEATAEPSPEPLDADAMVREVIERVATKECVKVEPAPSEYVSHAGGSGFTSPGQERAYRRARGERGW